MKVKMAEQTADLIVLLVAMVASDSILSIWHQHGKKRSNLVKSEYFGRFYGYGPENLKMTRETYEH